ncbi:hypothetical protein B566_EDAN015777 [Ephemera danica]|nr:hypothetical protein B566_EDAN015777 [Ephemera danica]
MLKIGFLGSGKMAQALAKGFISSVQDNHLLEEFKSLGSKITNNNEVVAQEARVLILAVKPSAVPTVLDSIKNYFTPNHMLLSIAMGVPLSHLEKMLGHSPRVLRAMPNTAAAVSASAGVLCSGTHARAEDVALGARLLGAVGTCRLAPESCFDAVTALSGSGPAYFLAIMEALSDGGVKMGLPRDLATHLAVQTAFGTAKMALESKENLSSLREAVTSPAGSTAAGLHELEKGAVRGWLTSAVEAATDRCRAVTASLNDAKK